MAITDPNLGLNYGYALGEDGWNVGVDNNWRKLGGLAFLSVINRTTTTQPGSPSNGDRYIIPTGSSWGSTNQVAVRVAGVWEFYTPHEGWRCYDQTTGQYLVYTVANGWKQIIGVRVPSTGTGVFDVVFENTENLTANRTLTITLNNANRSIALGGNLTLAKNLTTTGSGHITFSAAADASVAVPATGTLATINGSETLTNKTLTSAQITSDPSGNNDAVRKAYVDSRKIGFSYSFFFINPNTPLANGADPQGGQYTVPSAGELWLTDMFVAYHSGSHTSGGSVTFEVVKLGAGNIGSATLDNTNNAVNTKYSQTTFGVAGVGIQQAAGTMFVCVVQNGGRIGTISERNVAVVIRGYYIPG
jgi:uncharacterized protein DUF2793